jgi:hypothetical protein
LNPNLSNQVRSFVCLRISGLLHSQETIKELGKFCEKPLHIRGSGWYLLPACGLHEGKGMDKLDFC